MFTLKIKTENAAFSDDRNAEIARILREVAEQLETHTMTGSCRDYNGNRVGEFKFS